MGVRFIKARLGIMEGARGVREIIVREMVERKDAHPGGVERIQRRHLALERSSVLETEEEGGLSARPDRVDLVGGLGTCRGGPGEHQGGAGSGEKTAEAAA